MENKIHAACIACVDKLENKESQKCQNNNNFGENNHKDFEISKIYTESFILS